MRIALVSAILIGAIFLAGCNLLPFGLPNGPNSGGAVSPPPPIRQQTPQIEPPAGEPAGGGVAANGSGNSSLGGGPRLNASGAGAGENGSINASAINGSASGESPEKSGNATPAEEEDMQIVFLDVGMGDATLIKAGGKVILIDAGNGGGELLQKLSRLGISGIDLLIVSTWDMEAAGGVRQLLRELEVGEVWVSKQVPQNFEFESIRDYIDRQEVIVRNPKAGDVREIGGVKLEVFNPQEPGYPNNPRANSISMRADFGKFCAFLPSDLEQETEPPVVGMLGGRTCAVYKWGNNGEGRPVPSILFVRVEPAEAIISVGPNDLGLPSSTTIQRIGIAHAGIYRTDIDGDIYVRASRNGSYFIDAGMDLQELAESLN